MRLLGIFEKVKKYFSNVGWEKWQSWGHNVYEEMSLEFLASYIFTISQGYSLGTPNVIQFIQIKFSCSVSIIEFGLHLGCLQVEYMKAR